MQSEIGTLQGYAYVTPFDAIQHMAFVYGRIGDGKDMLARLHRADIIRDVFGGANPVHAALQRFKQEGRGVIVFLRDGAAGVPTHAIPQAGSTGSEVARSRQWREVGLGAQILKDLGISSIRLLTSAKLTYVGLAGFGIEIAVDRDDRRQDRAELGAWPTLTGGRSGSPMPSTPPRRCRLFLPRCACHHGGIVSLTEGRMRIACIADLDPGGGAAAALAAAAWTA